MNNITIELCNEDRARLDKLIGLLEARAVQAQFLIDNAFTDQKKVDDFIAKQTNIPKKKTDEDASKTAQDEPKASDHPTLDPFPETPTAKAEPSEENKTDEAAAQTVTLADIRQKIMDLSAKDKKDQARDVIFAYGINNVKDLAEEHYAEVYQKLTALED